MNISQLKSIAKDLQNVKINQNQIKNLLMYKDQLGRHWLQDSTYRLNELNREEKLLFILILDSTSFSYWGEPNWKINHNGVKVNGARAMILALRNAVDSGLLKFNARYLSNLPRETYRQILKGTCDIPLFEERFQIIRALGTILNERFGGKVKNLIQKAKGDALKLVEVLTNTFSFFKDFVIYEDQTIPFQKKAQLFALDIVRTNLAELRNLHKLTACADYKLPQVLRRFGIFEYSSHLSKLVDNNIPLPKNSVEEIEIRIKTILAVEMIKAEFKKQGIETQSYEINDLLWLLGQKWSRRDGPYHKTRTTKY